MRKPSKVCRFASRDSATLLRRSQGLKDGPMSSCLLSKQAFLLRSGLSLSSLNRHLREGRIRYVRLGSRVLIPEAEIQRLADLAAPGGFDAPVIAEPLTADRSEV